MIGRRSWLWSCRRRAFPKYVSYARNEKPGFAKVHEETVLFKLSLPLFAMQPS